MRLWIFAWALIFLHFFVQLFETRTGVLEGIIESIDLAALELAGIVFLVSLTTIAEHRRKRLALLSLLGLPTVFHAVAITLNWNHWRTLAAAVAVVFFGGAAFLLSLHRKPSLFHVCFLAPLIGLGGWAVYMQIHGNPEPAVTWILGLSYGLSGLLFWKRSRQMSPGVITVIGGFLAWGAVFPVGALTDYLFPHLQINPEIWNVPKFFVAFGMILSLLEDKSRIIEENSVREHAENALLLRFSRITSRLLAGKDPATLCGEIADAITETTNFRRAAILLAREEGSLYLAGSSGFSPADGEALRKQASYWRAEKMQELCDARARLGNNSFHVGQGGLMGRAIVPAPQNGGPSKNGEAREEVIVPLLSSRGACLGWIALATSSAGLRSYASEMMKLEMLAADLAVTFENARLHHQLVRSEKLAALGQLVAGVAHELNNPLTGIIGYTELLSEEVKSEGAAKKVVKLGNEARRMHRIVSGLLRFARQNNPTSHSASFEAVLHEALQLREYHLRKQGVQVETKLDPFLPPLAIGEDELKQIILNLLSNAVDAVEESHEKIIRIEARRRGDRIVFRLEDSGPGFTDLNRAFDPFYTTKPVGKGTGLGLSICYGVVRESCGEIHLANKQPYGASVIVELPVAVSEPAITTPA